jgi:hypothetical protein
MGVTVNTFSVSTDMLSIDIEVDFGVGFVGTEFLLWTDKTYKDPDQSIDLSSFISELDQVNTFTITSADAGLSYFDGLYFAQFKASELTLGENQSVIVATAALTQYYIVMAYLLVNVDLSCLNCNTNLQNATLFDLYLEAMKGSLIVGRFSDAIYYYNKIQIIRETSECDDCDDITPLVSSAGNIVSVGVIDCKITSTEI